MYKIIKYIHWTINYNNKPIFYTLRVKHTKIRSILLPVETLPVKPFRKAIKENKSNKILSETRFIAINFIAINSTLTIRYTYIYSIYEIRVYI